MVKRIENFLVIGILIFIFIEVWQIGKFWNIFMDAIIPVFVGVFISFLLEPLIVRLERKKLSRKVSCFVVYTSLSAVLALLVVSVLPRLINQLKDFQIYIPQILNYFDGMDSNMESRIMEMGSNVWDKVSGTFSSFASIAIGAGAALYLSIDFEKVTNFYYDLAPKQYRRWYRAISKEMGQTIFMFCRYMLYDTILFFIMASLVIWIAGIDYPLAFGALLALTNLIPYIGPYIGMIPFAIYGFMNDVGVLCIVIGIGLQTVENCLISPLLLKNMIYLHPVLGIFGMSFFGSLFGLWGMIFSPLIIVLLKLLVSHLFLLEKKEKIVYNASEIDDKDK